MTPPARARVLLESVALVLVLVPVHFFLRRPDPTAWSASVALLVFFLPTVVAVVRLRPGPREAAVEGLAYLVFGFGLGLLVGGLSGIVHGILHLLTGEPLPVRLALWIAIAAGWAMASAAAYAIILFLVWSLRMFVDSQEHPDGARESPVAPGAAGASAHTDPARLGLAPRAGRRSFAIAAGACGIAGLAVAMAGVVLILENRAAAPRLIGVGAALLALTAILCIPAALTFRH